VLEAGEPPGNVHAYVEIVPSGSLPVPENETAPPGLTVRFVAGFTIVAVGA
jgi:hypothetical protein